MLKLFHKQQFTLKSNTISVGFCIRNTRSVAKDRVFAAHDHLKKPLSPVPEPHIYEPIWADFWRASYIFASRATKPDSPHFSILFPPPNITGTLHLGHALTLAIQDAYARHQRMHENANFAFIPGYDHAGIATYLQLEKFLKATQGKNLRDMSEEDFSKFFALWKERRINETRDNLDRLGASFDYHREYFTLDPTLCGAVASAFIRLYDKGLIQRKKSQILWSYALRSTVSDIEVSVKKIDGLTKLKVPGIEEPVEFGIMHTILFPLDDKRASGKGIKVSTMNLYSMPGDVAVAVNPNDSRYFAYHNKLLYNPISGRSVPVIIDQAAKMDFATGAVKITPASSPLDYEVAVRHQIPFDNFMNEDGTLMASSIASEHKTLKDTKNRFEATKEIQQILIKMGLYIGCEERSTKIPICTRNDDVIERRLKSQWFLDTKPGYRLLRNRIENGTFEIIPITKTNILLKWLNDPRDWCISRQIPFGHQIPAYKLLRPDGEKEWIVARSFERASQKALEKYHDKGIVLEQDKDVLDTWFSSALLPLSALDWPNVESPYFKFYYPWSLMETGFDILNFWVMKMVLISTYLTGMMPFNKVFLHGMVCDGRGKKMSKSIGNAINPIDVIQGVQLTTLNDQSKCLHESGLLSSEEYENAIHTQKSLFPRGIAPCGADGLRLSLYECNPKVDKISFSVNHLESNRNLINKIWQVFRFLHNHSYRCSEPVKWFRNLDELIINRNLLSSLDRWIISRLYTFLKDFHGDIQKFSFIGIYRRFVTFWLSCLSDIYLEGIKPENQDQLIDDLKLKVLAQVICTTLIAMNPLIPFITEEVYQRLKRLQNPEKADIRSISLERFPDLNVLSQFHDAKLEDEMSVIIACKKVILNFKSECQVSREEMRDLQIKIMTGEISKTISMSKIFSRLTKCPNVSFLNNLQESDYERWIRLHITDETVVLIEPNCKYFQPLLQKLEKSILRLQARVVKAENSEQQLDSKDLNLLTRLESDRAHLIRLLDARETSL